MTCKQESYYSLSIELEQGWGQGLCLLGSIKSCVEPGVEAKSGKVST